MTIAAEIATINTVNSDSAIQWIEKKMVSVSEGEIRDTYRLEDGSILAVEVDEDFCPIMFEI